MLSFPLWGSQFFTSEEACTTCVATPKKIVSKKATKKEQTKADDGPKQESKAALIARYIEAEKKSPVQRKGSGTCAGIGYEAADNLLSRARDQVNAISPFVLKKLIDNADDFILLDVREAEQRSEGEIYVDESYAMTRGNLEFRIMNLLKDKDAIIVTYCRSGGRSAFAAQTLMELGYKNVYDLEGGLKNWVAFGYPFENGLGVVVKVVAE
jgi:rhodanese-related sulfurtransferase